MNTCKLTEKSIFAAPLNRTPSNISPLDLFYFNLYLTAPLSQCFSSPLFKDKEIRIAHMFSLTSTSINVTPLMPSSSSWIKQEQMKAPKKIQQLNVFVVSDSIGIDSVIQMHRKALRGALAAECIGSEGTQTLQLIHHGSSVRASELLKPWGEKM